jgi:hypothetical protein
MKILSLALLLLVFSLQVSPAGSPAGIIIGWGDNALYGCNGVPSPRDSAGVVTIFGQVLTNAIAISGGSGDGGALLSDGTVFCWGLDVGDAVGASPGPEATNGLVKLDGNVLSNVVEVSHGDLALKSDGTVVGWRFYRDKNLLAGLTNITAVNGNLAIRGDGTVAAFGKGIHGDKYGVPAGLSNVVGVASSSAFLALKNDGTVVEWYGGSPDTYLPVPGGLSNIVAIAAGGSFCIALNKNGIVTEWGNGSSQGAEIMSNITSIASFGNYSLALKNDSTVVGWGHGRYYPRTVPAGLSNVVAIAVGETFCLAITTNTDVAERFMPKNK